MAVVLPSLIHIRVEIKLFDARLVVMNEHVEYKDLFAERNPR